MKKPPSKKLKTAMDRLHEIGREIKKAKEARTLIEAASHSRKIKVRRGVSVVAARRNLLSLLDAVDVLGKHLFQRVDVESPSAVRRYLGNAIDDIAQYGRLYAAAVRGPFASQMRLLLTVEQKREVFEEIKDMLEKASREVLGPQFDDLWRRTISKAEQEELARRNTKLPFALNPDYEHITKKGKQYPLQPEAAQVVEELAKRYLRDYPNIQYEKKKEVLGGAGLGGKKLTQMIRHCRKSYKTLVEEDPGNIRRFRLRS